MNHYAPQQLTDSDGNPSGKWHYCLTTRGGTFAVGPCGLLRGCTACAGTIPTNPFGPMKLPPGVPPNPGDCGWCNGTGVQGVPEAERCPGHATPELACEHYREHLIATARLFPETPDMLRRATSSHKCQVPRCTKFTVGHATWGIGAGGAAYLCEAHCKRDCLHHVISVGESWQS